jgi:hypothetical protein
MPYDENLEHQTVHQFEQKCTLFGVANFFDAVCTCFVVVSNVFEGL